MILINEQQIRNRIPASANIEMSLLRPNIILYQETRLEEILGSTFYNDISTKYTNQTLNANEQALLQNYIHPCIIYGGLNISIPFLFAQISNRGIIQQTGDFTNTAGDLAFRQLRETVKNSIDNYEQKLIKWPLWTNFSTDVSKPEEQSPNDFGMVLDFFGQCSEDYVCSTSGPDGSIELKPYINAFDYQSGLITTMTASNTYYKLNTQMSSPHSYGFTFSNESFVYNLTTPKLIELTGIASLKCGFTNDIEVAFFINNQLYPCSQQQSSTSFNKPETIPFHCLAQLSQGDKIEVFVKNNTSTTDIELYHLNVILKQIV